jgi:hypothetical protein
MAPLIGLRNNLGYVGTHAFLLAGAVGMLFLQRYIWLLRIAEQGYGPYQTVSYLATLSAVMVLIDLLVLKWALRGSQTSKIVSLLWPTFFFLSALWVVIGNNA